jgi:hypothetical protein
MTSHEAFVGFDVHKETIAVAIARAGGDVGGFGTIKNRAPIAGRGTDGGLGAGPDIQVATPG